MTCTIIVVTYITLGFNEYFKIYSVKKHKSSLGLFQQN